MNLFFTKRINMKNKTITLIIITLLIAFSVNIKAQETSKPKLMVTIIVDQMRNEYLYRFNHLYGEDGFKRLMNDGMEFRDVHFNYVPTFTGPGHSSVFTGTTPKYHGIIGNSWYSRKDKKSIYCVEDSTAQTIGSDSNKGLCSPHYQLATTVCDELENSTQKRAITCSISLKDRAAILSAGHQCDNVFWYDNTCGKFITSSYFMNELPAWLNRFNDKKLADNYMQQDWDLMLPASSYADSYEDDSEYEYPGNVIEGMEKPVFPYHLKKIGKKHNPYDLLIHTPYGNTILTDLAIDAIENNDFGKDDITDMLMISYSSTDAIGHLWGPQSKEVEDTYLRLDRDIARLLKTLDEKVGKGNYTLMLTADHAVGEVIDMMKSRHVPAGYFHMDKAAAVADSVLDARYGQQDWIEGYRNHLIYLNESLFAKNNIDRQKATTEAALCITRQLEGVYQAYTCYQLMENEYTTRGAFQIQMGYNTKRSGDIILTFLPGWATGKPKAAADHGTQYNYDSHVPCLFYGKNIPQGQDITFHNITDVAPTISLLIHTMLPNATIGKPLEILWK